MIEGIRGRITALAKRKQHKSSRGGGAGLDKKISHAIRRLGLIDSRCDEETFYGRAGEILGGDEVDSWMRVSAFGSYEDNYDFQYSSAAHALVTSVSWRSWPLEVELRWMLPRLKQALECSGAENQYLVEFGAGPGAASAVASAVLGVPIISTDIHPKTRGLPEELAALTGGDVHSEVIGALDLAEVFHDDPPAAVFGLGIFRYVVPHVHKPGSFSDSHSVMEFMNESASPEAAHFFESVSPAEVLLAEQMCSDYLGEIMRDCTPEGYGIAQNGVERLFHRIPGEESDCVCVHLTPDLDRQVVDSPLACLVGPLPVVEPGLVTEGLTAELVRDSLVDSETTEIVEFSWPNGSVLRRELFTLGALSGSYRASNIGFRELKVVAGHHSDRLRRELLDEERYWNPPDVERSTIALSPLFW